MPHELDGEDAPRPFHTYLILGVLIVVVIAGAYMNRDAITALVTGVGSSSGSTLTTGSDLGGIILREPSCFAECGRPCWLDTSGVPAGTYQSSGGRIGLSGCVGECFSTLDIAANVRCCRNSDCPKDEPICSAGVCF